MKRVEVGGAELAVIDRGSGTPLLLVHGFPLDHTMWRGQIEDFSADCRVVAPDLRGFGRSEVTEGTVSMGEMADDLDTMLDRLGIDEQVVFCGLSMGGYVAWQFWAHHPERVRALILCDTRAIPDSPEAAEGRRKTAESVVAHGPAALAEGMIPKLFAKRTMAEAPETVQQTREVILGTDPQGIAAAARGMAERPDATPLLPKIHCPTLLVVGSEDTISTAEEMGAIAASMPQARLVEIPEAGHMSPLEQPEAVNGEIREFLVDLWSD